MPLSLNMKRRQGSGRTRAQSGIRPLEQVVGVAGDDPAFQDLGGVAQTARSKVGATTRPKMALQATCVNMRCPGPLRAVEQAPR